MQLACPPSSDTDAFRLLDGESVCIDTFAANWLVQTRGAAFPGQIRTESGWRSLWHKRLEIDHRQAPEHVAGRQFSAPFEVTEHGVRFEIDFQAGYSQGLFLDQRLNRLAVRERVRPGDRILNTFAYTCGFSVVAALAGATTTSVDLSKNYLEWGKRNFQRNGLSPGDHFFTRGDTFDWFRRWDKSGIRFDGIVLDPPTFSRNSKGKVFRVGNDLGELIELARGVLNPGGWLLCCTNFRGIAAWDFESLARAAAGRGAKLETRPMPPEFTAEAYLKTVWVDLA